MDLQLGDLLVVEQSEWEIIGRPFATAGGKTVHARVRKVGQRDLTDLRTWDAHEHVTVRRPKG